MTKRKLLGSSEFVTELIMKYWCLGGIGCFWLIVLAVLRKKKYNKHIYENMVNLLVWHNKE